MLKTVKLAQSPVVTVFPPGRLQWVAAGVMIAVAVIATIAAIPHGMQPLPADTGFIPAFGSISLFADFVTSMLLLGQARAARSQASARLAAAYFFCFLIVIAHLLSLPGPFAQTPLLGGTGTATWLWCVWHFGFPIGIASYALSSEADPGPPDGGIKLFGAIFAVALAAVLMTTLGLQDLPNLLGGETYRRLNTLGIGPLLVACNGIALALLVIRQRGSTALALWLTVAMAFSTLDVVLGTLVTERFTLAWYLSRTLSLMSNLTVFIALLLQSMHLSARAAVMNRHLEHLTLTDQLTQLPNRRAFERSFDAEWKRVEREDLPISMLMIDIDMFKGFNDRLGHPAGDDCLRAVARTVNALARRPLDIVARLGGEEFALLLPNTDPDGACQMGENVRSAVEGLRIDHPGVPRGHVTVSVGVATLYPHGQTWPEERLIEQADAALYRAKREGRNRVVSAASDARADSGHQPRAPLVTELTRAATA